MGAQPEQAAQLLNIHIWNTMLVCQIYFVLALPIHFTPGPIHPSPINLRHLPDKTLSLRFYLSLKS